MEQKLLAAERVEIDLEEESPIKENLKRPVSLGIEQEVSSMSNEEL